MLFERACRRHLLRQGRQGIVSPTPTRPATPTIISWTTSSRSPSTKNPTKGDVDFVPNNTIKGFASTATTTAIQRRSTVTGRPRAREASAPRRGRRVLQASVPTRTATTPSSLPGNRTPSGRALLVIRTTTRPGFDATVGLRGVHDGPRLLQEKVNFGYVPDSRSPVASTATPTRIPAPTPAVKRPSGVTVDRSTRTAASWPPRRPTATSGSCPPAPTASKIHTDGGLAASTEDPDGIAD